MHLHEQMSRQISIGLGKILSRCPLAKITLDLMKRAKLGFRKAMLIVGGGFVHDCVTDAVVLLSVLEECSGKVYKSENITMDG